MEDQKQKLALLICRYNGQKGTIKQVQKMRKNYLDNLENMETYLIQRKLISKK